MFAVSKYPLGAYFGPQPSIPCVGRAPMPIARMAASTALPSHCRAICASQMPRSPQGHHIQGPPVPTPHADETHPEHRSRSRFGFSGSRTAQNPNPTRRNKLRRREDHQEDCPRMQVPSSRCVEPIAWPCSTGLRLPRADRISSIVNHFRQFLISSAEVRNIRVAQSPRYRSGLQAFDRKYNDGCSGDLRYRHCRLATIIASPNEGPREDRLASCDLTARPLPEDDQNSIQRT
jgi:hypothetical protein